MPVKRLLTWSPTPSAWATDKRIRHLREAGETLLLIFYKIPYFGDLNIEGNTEMTYTGLRITCDSQQSMLFLIHKGHNTLNLRHCLYMFIPAYASELR